MYDMGLNSARHAPAEHHDMDELVEDLQALDAAGGTVLNDYARMLVVAALR